MNIIMGKNTSAITENEKLVIDNCVGLRALRLYIKNSNMEVGQVTVRHLVFSELIVQLQRTDNVNIPEDKVLEDSVAIFDFCFGNKHTIKEGKGKKRYESPLNGTDRHGNPCYFTDEFGIDCLTISPRIADLIYKECKEMEINRENVIAACMDLISAGRMFQELTIDSCKTLYNVKIPWGQSMECCHIFTRDSDDENLNVVCNWKYMNSTEEEKTRERERTLRSSFSTSSGGKNQKSWKILGNVRYVVNESKSYTRRNEKRGDRRINVRYVNDFQHQVRRALLSLGINFANELMEEKQEFSPVIMEEITNAMRRKNMRDARDLAHFFHDGFRTIVSFQRKSIADARAKYPKNSAALNEHEKGIKRDAKVAMKRLANQLRIEFHKLGLSQRDYVLVMLNIVISENNNSSYAHMVLEQEFFSFAISCYENNGAPKYTEDRLIHCDFEVGEVVRFEAGKAQGVDTRKAYSTVPLCGEFIIREDKFGKKVASQRLDDLVKSPETDTDKLVFITKPGGGKDNFTCRNLQRITKEMVKPGKKVTLVPYIKGDKTIHDAIVIDGVVVGSFRCSFAKGGTAMNSQALTNMYLYKQGVVDSIIVSDQGDKVHEIGVITLKEVITVPAPKITGNWILEEANRRKEEIKKNFGGSMLRLKRFDVVDTSYLFADSKEKKESEEEIVVAPKNEEVKPRPTVMVTTRRISAHSRFDKYGKVGF